MIALPDGRKVTLAAVAFDLDPRRPEVEVVVERAGAATRHRIEAFKDDGKPDAWADYLVRARAAIAAIVDHPGFPTLAQVLHLFDEHNGVNEPLASPEEQAAIRAKVVATDAFLRFSTNEKHESGHGNKLGDYVPADHALKPGDAVTAPEVTFALFFGGRATMFRCVVKRNLVAGPTELRIQGASLMNYGIVSDPTMGRWRPRIAGLDAVSRAEREAREVVARVRPFGARDDFDAKEYANALTANPGVKSAEVAADAIDADGKRRVRLKVEVVEPMDRGTLELGVDDSPP